MDTDEHQDILDWLDEQSEGRRSSAIRMAIRAAIQVQAEADKPSVVDVHQAVIELGNKLVSNEVSLADVLQAVTDLGTKLEGSQKDLAEVRQAVVNLDRKLAHGVTLRGDDADNEKDVPPEVFDALDGLGLD